MSIYLNRTEDKTVILEALAHSAQSCQAYDALFSEKGDALWGEVAKNFVKMAAHILELDCADESSEIVRIAIGNREDAWLLYRAVGFGLGQYLLLEYAASHRDGVCEVRSRYESVLRCIASELESLESSGVQ